MDLPYLSDKQKQGCNVSMTGHHRQEASAPKEVWDLS